MKKALLLTLALILLIAFLLLRGCRRQPAQTACVDGRATYSSAPMLFVADNGQPVSDTITVPDVGFVTDIDVTLTIQHPQHGDLNIDLQDPVGNTVRLIQTEGGPADGMHNVTFDDEAAGPPPGFVVNGTCLVNSSFTPGPDALSSLDGVQIHGDWTLTVVDVSPSDAVDCDCDGFVVGAACPRTLDQWSIRVECSDTVTAADPVAR